MTRRLRTSSAALALFALAACGVLDRSETALIESAGSLGDGRDWAMRITVLELGEETGGFVEYFALDGVYNTPDEPYVAPTGCSYFGPVPTRNRGFRIVADGVVETETLIAQARWIGARRTEAEILVERAGGTGAPTADGATLLFVRDPEQRPDRRCSRLARDLPGASGTDASADDVASAHDAGGS